MALYHKYRPQIFEDIVGQEHVKQTLKNQIKSNDFAQAYLFSGPRGIGKTTTARILAKSLNCEKKDGSEVEPDNSTQCAQEINESRSIDVIEIDAASHTGVDNVREQIIENAQFQPTKLDYKVFIIDEVHMLSNSAFNALLKTLEEPPEHVVFVLATTEPHELPDTIISRCQRFDFKKIGHNTLHEYIEKIAGQEEIEIEESVLNRIIDKSDGCVRDAISLLDQATAASEDKITEETASLVLPKTDNEDSLEFLNILIEDDIKEGLKKLNRMADDGINMVEFALNCVELLRYMMVHKSGAKTNRAGVDLTKKIKETLSQYTNKIEYKEIVELIDLFLDRKQEIKSAPLPQLPLELLVLEWCEDNRDSSSSKQTQKQHNDDNATKDTKETETMKNSTPKKDEQEKKEKGKITETKTQQETKNSGEKSTKLEEIKGKWNEFIDEVEARSPSLVFILKMSKIASTKNNKVWIQVQYKFHKEKLTQNNNKKQIEAALSEAVDKDIDIEVKTKPDESTQDEELDDLATAIGGKVIN